MTIALTNPAVAGPFGGGYFFAVYNDVVGPIPLDDIGRCTIFDAAGLNRLVGGSGRANGLSTVSGWLGINTEAVSGYRGDHGQVLPGAAVSVYIEWLHADGSGHITTNVPGLWTYDPVGGLGELIELVSRTGSQADIRAAVLKTLQNSP